MRAGFQVGHVVLRDTVDHQQQWQDSLAQFRAVNDAGFDSYCYGNHFLIDPFQHFQPWTVLARMAARSEEHTSELQSLVNLVCRLLLEKKK